jgi:branched-chain amino acid transport system substrate-binding protein
VWWLGRQGEGRVQPCRIGAILPLTGDLSYLGTTQRNSISLAVEEAAAKGGVGGRPVEVKFEDSKGDAQQAALLMNRLLSVDRITIDKVYLTGCALAVAPIAKERKALLDAGSMLTGIEDGNNYVFRLYQGVDTDAATLVNFLRSEKDAQRDVKVALLRLKSAVFDAMSEKYLRPGLVSNGIAVVDEEVFDFGTANFNDKVVKIAGANPTYLVVMTYATDLPSIFRALDENRLIQSLTVLGGLDVAMADQNQMPQAYRSRVVVSAPDFVLAPSAAARAFSAKYQERFGSAPTYDAAIGYDATNLLLAAMERAGSDQAEPVRSALRETRIYNGVLGEISITPQGGMTVPVRIAHFEGLELKANKAGN